MLELKLNDFISLKLLEGKTKIFIKNKEFKFYCKPLILTIDKDEIQDYDEIKSIDDTINNVNYEESRKIEIPPEQEFWGHASNMQVWAESQYNLKLIHTNLGFPLLRALYDAGDPKAKKVFKDELAKRFCSKSIVVAKYLFIEGYLCYFNKEELESIINFYNDLLKKNTPRENINFLLILSYCYQQIEKYSKSNEILKLILKFDLNTKPNSFRKHVLVCLASSYCYQKKYDKAEKYISDLINRYPDKIKNLYSLVNILGPKNDKISLIYLLPKIIEIDSRDEKAWGLLIEAYMDTLNFEFAKVSFKNALKLIPGFLHEMIQLNLYYINNHHYNEHLFISNLILECEPCNLNTLKCLIKTHFNREDYEQTVKKCKRVLSLSSKEKVTLEYLGYAYYKQNKLEKAKKTLEFLLQIDSSSKNGLRLFSLIGNEHNKLKQYDQAINSFETALSFANKIESETIFEDIVDELIFTYDSYACILFKEKKFQESIDIHLKALKLAQKWNYYDCVDECGIFKKLGRVYSKIFELNLSTKLFRKILTIEPFRSNRYEYLAFTHYNIAYGLFKRGNYQESINLYLKVLKIVQENYTDIIYEHKLFNNLGKAYTKIKKYDLAIKSFNSALGEDPNDANVINNLAYVYHIKKEINKGFNLCKKALSINPLNDRVIGKLTFHMACLEAHKQNIKNSLKSLKNAINCDYKYINKAESSSCFNQLKDLKQFKELIASKKMEVEDLRQRFVETKYLDDLNGLDFCFFYFD